VAQGILEERGWAAWEDTVSVRGGVKPLYAVAVYCMEYTVTATNYLIHHLSFQLFP